jgi:hypothetical protein
MSARGEHDSSNKRPGDRTKLSEMARSIAVRSATGEDFAVTVDAGCRQDLRVVDGEEDREPPIPAWRD